MTHVFEYPHEVRSDEIDEQGHVNNVVYVAWMQHAAVAHSAALGWTAARYRELGAGWVARTHHIEYLRPAMAGDKVVVQTHVAEMKKATSLRRYRIVRPADGVLLARAETDWAFINFTTGRPARIPPEVVEAYLAAASTNSAIPTASR
jgi:acyl-CoA thioester hydrolase